MSEQKLINPCAQLSREAPSPLRVPEANITLMPQDAIIKFSEAKTASALSEGSHFRAGVNLLIANVISGDSPFQDVVVKTPRSSSDYDRIKKESELTAVLAQMGISSVPFLPIESEVASGASIELNGVSIPAVISRFAPKGDLGRQANQPKGHRAVEDFIGQMSSAIVPIVDLATKGKIVCDIKPQNFLLYDGIGDDNHDEISFVDYGSIENANSKAAENFGFTNGYCPTELLDGSGLVSERSAIFGIGMSVINIVAGGAIVYSGLDKASKGAVGIDSPYDYVMGRFSNEVADILEASIEPNPNNRPATLKEVEKVFSEAC